jgi:hypothetical protein
MSQFRLRPVLIALIGLIILAQPSLGHQTQNSTNRPLSNQDVVDLVKTGLSSEVILAKIKVGPCNFDVSTDGLKGLKAAGVPDNLILAMVEASAPPKDASGVNPAANATSASGFAHLHVYRHRRYVGSALAPSIYIDDKQVVRIGDGRRCTIKLSLGTHAIRSDDKSSLISLDIKAGQDYYIRIDEDAGFWKGHGRLTLLAAEQGAAEYKLQKPVEEDRKIAKDMIEEDGSLL